MITSGSLSHVSAFESAGGFNEKFFIDLVDFDYCTKLRKNGYELVQLAGIGMHHKVGDSVIRSVFGVPVTVYNHAPFRSYYQVRNAFFFFKENIRFDPVLSFYVLLDVIRVPLKAVLFEKDKKKRLRYAVKGLKDGLKGKIGKIDVQA